MMRNIPYAYCEACHKRGYYSKRGAKQAAKVWHSGDKGIREYRCPESEVLWHLGHIPKVLRQRGTVSRRSVFEVRS